MNVKRKTIRFQDNLSDLSAYEAITEYKKYGFRSESHMVIEAVRRLIGDSSTSLDAERIADLIAERLSGKLSIDAGSTVKESEKNDEDAYDAALDFLDSL